VELIAAMASRILLLAGLAALSSIAQARDVPERPLIKPYPLQPYKAFPSSTPRNKSCFVKPSCTQGQDDSAKILAAFEECNDGGTVVLDEEYTVCSPLDLRFLKHIDVALTGTVNFCDDYDDWQSELFRFPFQDQGTWWLWGGEDINLYGAGTGTIDGNGQTWYDAYAEDSTLLRPLLFVTDGWHGGSITGLKLRQSPQV
jgi:galacturan 1,4-alpha-galacturonidase